MLEACGPVPQQDKRVPLMGNCLRGSPPRGGAGGASSSLRVLGDEVPLGWLRDEGSRRIRQRGGNGLLAGYHGNAPLTTSEATEAESGGGHF